MRPVHLHVEGLRSFRAGVDVAFDGRNHIAIIGDTGAGKSSLLQAITYALFGRTTWSGQANQELMNDTSTQLRVVLDFVVSGQHWQVTRILKRAGDGTVGGARATLKKVAADGETVLEQLEKSRDVTERIEEILGLDFEAFIRTVLLPQGEFARLLVGDKPTERAAILRQVWRTDELTAAGATADSALNELKPVLARVEQALVDEPDDPDAHLAALTTAAEETEAAATEAAGDRTTAQAAAGKLAAGQQRTDAADAVIGSLAGCDLDAAAHDARGVADAAERLRVRLAELDTDRGTVAGQLAAVPDDSDGPSAAQVATGLEQLRRLPEMAEDLHAQAQEWIAAGEVADTAEKAAGRAAKQADAAELAASARAGERAELAAAAEAAQVRLGTVRDAVRVARTAVGQAAEKADAADRLAEDAAAAKEAAEAAAQRRTDLEQAAEQAAAAVEVARRHDAAAAAADGLHPGDDCPVCATTLAQGWDRPTSGALEDARREEAAARTEAATARDAATAAATEASSLTSRAEAARADAAAAQTAAQRSIAEVADLLGLDHVDVTADDATLLAEVTEAVRTAQGTLTSFDATTRELTGAASGARASATAAQQRATEVAAQAAAAGLRAEATLQRLAALRDALPAGIDVEVPSTVSEAAPEVAGMDEAVAKLEQRQQVLADREAQRTALRARIDRIDADIDAARKRGEGDVAGPAAVLARTLDGHRDALAAGRRALADVGGDVTAVEVPDVAAGVTAGQLPDHVAAVADATETLRAAAAAVIEAAQQDWSMATQTLHVLDARLEARAAEAGEPYPTGDGEDLDAIAERLVATLNDRVEETAFTARQAAAAVEAFAERCEPLKALRAAHDELAATCRVVGDVVAALKPGAFPKWLTLRRSRALLVYASRLLGEMTNGRYAFADLDDDQAAWLIIDNDSGLPRSPQSLSGGEQFIASLSLALGIVEMMARSGGRLESLWLDEGFGALDRTNLDLAVESLASVAAGGRMVAVISHVAAVAEQVEHVLAVTRSVTGSTVEWLSAAQRSDVAAEDVSARVAGALAGLLD